MSRVVIGRASVDDLKVLQYLREFVLIGGVVRIPFEALFRCKRLILAGLGVKLVIDRLKHFGDRGRFQEFAYAWKRGHCGIEALGARLQERKTRGPGRVLPRFDVRFEIRIDVQEFVYAFLDAIGLAPDCVELNDQNVFRRKTVEIWPEVARETSEVSKKRIFHHLLKRFRQRSHHGVSVVPIPGINHLNRRPQADQELDIAPVSGDPGRRFLQVEVRGTKLSAAGNRSHSGRKLFVIPGDTSVKAAQLLAGDSPQDRISEIIDFFVRGEADLRMGLKLG